MLPSAQRSPCSRTSRRAALLCALLLFGAPQLTAAQAVDGRWRIAGELGVAPGATWLEGVNVPTVQSGVGAFGTIGVQRGWSPRVAGGVDVRVLTAKTSLDEHGVQWDGGRATEVSLLATTSIYSGNSGVWRWSFDLLGGVTMVSGPDGVVPFRDASKIAPTAEAGVSLRRGAVGVAASRRELSVFARYSVMRLGMTGNDAIATDGIVSRILAGVRVAP